MPTGYTAGIISGETETFQDYAKQCMRAFGACIHMRDEPFHKEYEPRTPSDYHLDALEEAREKLKKVENYTDAELIKIRTEQIEGSKKYHLEQISKIKESRTRLDKFLSDAIAFESPTPEYDKFRDFMVEQLETTIEYDGDTKFYESGLLQLESELNNIDANVIRAQLLKDINWDIEYHLKEYNEEVERCTQSNAWVEKMLQALNQDDNNKKI